MVTVNINIVVCLSQIEAKYYFEQFICNNIVCTRKSDLQFIP